MVPIHPQLTAIARARRKISRKTSFLRTRTDFFSSLLSKSQSTKAGRDP